MKMALELIARGGGSLDRSCSAKVIVISSGLSEKSPPETVHGAGRTTSQRVDTIKLRDITNPPPRSIAESISSASSIAATVCAASCCAGGKSRRVKATSRSQS